MLDAISRAMAVITFDLDGTIEDANANFCDALGYRREEIVGRHHRMFCEADYAVSADYVAFWDRLGHGEVVAGEFRRLGKDGREIWIQASYNPILDASGRPVQVVKTATDITDQKLKFADYRGAARGHRQVAAVISFDLEGNILDANANFCAAIGYRREELVGKHHRMFCEPPYANSPAYVAFWKKLGRGEFEAGEFQRFGKGGKLVWIQPATTRSSTPADGRSK